MGRSLDIANLFRAFGGDPHRYREFELSDSLPGSVPPPAPSQSEEQPASTVPEELNAALPVSPAASAELPALAQELVQQHTARQAEKAVAALDQALNQVPPALTAPVLAVLSARGGTGKTVVAAGLAQTLARRGQKVLLVELDAQNVLSTLLQPELAVPAAAIPVPLTNCLSVTEQLQLLPFGVLSEIDLLTLELSLQRDPRWLARRLALLDVAADTLVIFDCPTGSTPLGRQALALATQVLGVTTADAAGYASLTRLERQMQDCASHARCAHLLNRVDPVRPLTQDIAAIVARSWGERLLGALPESPALERALTSGRGLHGLQDAWATALDELAGRLLVDSAAFVPRYVQSLP
ncbi:hypothetical protein SB11R_02990 [Pseudomonas oryzihabitans]|nr:hypothetical protein SB11R_02990 [Pseudomonas psychrotolerans]